MIIVKTLYSKAPVSHYDRKIRLEKLAVDTYCGKMQLDTCGKIDVISGICKITDFNTICEHPFKKCVQ